jgi:hypothetical protein
VDKYGHNLKNEENMIFITINPLLQPLHCHVYGVTVGGILIGNRIYWAPVAACYLITIRENTVKYISGVPQQATTSKSVTRHM